MIATALSFKMAVGIQKGFLFYRTHFCKKKDVFAPVFMIACRIYVVGDSYI